MKTNSEEQDILERALMAARCINAVPHRSFMQGVNRSFLFQGHKTHSRNTTELWRSVQAFRRLLIIVFAFCALVDCNGLCSVQTICVVACNGDNLCSVQTMLLQLGNGSRTWFL
jgi:hypothetical protein